VKTAVVLFNLGGPDSPESVRPFLFNMFSDKAILRVPGLPRWFLAQLISRLRAPAARRIYAHTGGASPLLGETEKQAAALTRELASRGDYHVSIAMRYWRPSNLEAAREILDYGPDRVILLPLYPQFSTATTASSLLAWQDTAKAAGLKVPHHAICCYPTDPGLIEGFVNRIRPIFEQASQASESTRPRILFSAHGLPQSVVDAGDPYPWQVEQTVRAVVERLGAEGLGEAGVDWVICYQSRLGPVKWIGPGLAEELTRAARDKVAVVVVPIAFVSEHSETLVELDIEFSARAAELGVPGYARVPALGTEAAFVRGLAKLVERAGEHAVMAHTVMAPGDNKLRCPANLCGCPLLGQAEAQG
jgi:ferrochelatase